MRLLHGRIRRYEWGSRSVIARLQGRTVPSPGPEAELWLGAHPHAPAMVETDDGLVSLAELLVAEPRRWLGDQVADRFGARLPFLLKVLAAEAPLSLQVHPDAEQARLGYAAEQAARGGVEAARGGVEAAGGDASPDTGASPGAPGCANYADPYHKPELLVAITPFEALCGFREPGRSARVLAALGIRALEPVVRALRRGPEGLAEAVRTLLSWPDRQRPELVAAAVVAPGLDGHRTEADLLRRLAAEHPADPGVLVALLLNHLVLAPGEAIWMPAGNLHAYLRGAGVEIMAASDNVLRGGLTHKRVDVAELLRILRFEVLDEPVLAPRQVAEGVVTWPVPVDDFALYGLRLNGQPVELPAPGPRVVLCVDGRVMVHDGADGVDLCRGGAAMGPASPGPLKLSGTGEVFVGCVGGSYPPGW